MPAAAEIDNEMLPSVKQGIRDGFGRRRVGKDTSFMQVLRCDD